MSYSASQLHSIIHYRISKSATAFAIVLGMICAGVPVSPLSGQDTDAPIATDSAESVKKDAAELAKYPQSDADVPEPATELSKPKPANKLVRLAKDGEVWLDMKNKRVIVGGTIVFRKGVLEMFACVKETKEHESIVAVNAKAYQVHAALLAVGAKPGKPVQYDPEYKPATGQVIKVEVVWKDENGKEHRRSAQDMIRNVRTQDQMKHDWVFAGSYFWSDEETGKKYYQAEGGELICVSNFSTAMLDLPVESSQSTGQLLFEAWTDNIPPLDTKVRLVLTPVPAPTEVKKSQPTAGTSTVEKCG